MLPAPFTPDFLSRLEALRLRTRKEVLGSRPGSYSSPRRGTSLEFADYRRYSPGDDIRYLDWGIFARSDRLYIKLFREEVDLFVYLFVDASGSMAFPSPKEKFSPACHTALALAYVVLANHDHVKLHLLQGHSAPTGSPFYRGRHRIMDCIDFVSSFSPGGRLEMAPALGEHLKRIRRPGKAILLSDFLMPSPSYQQGLNLLRAFNLDISVIQVLSRQEIDPPFPRGHVAVVDSESDAELRLQWTGDLHREYQERLARHNRQLRSFCHQGGIHYSLFVTDQELSEFVLETLPAIGLFK
ncbi:MAG: DUF58 domain-containing protein [Deltaproteobacteria bacterium]|nr:DUF58 domain-containing protein [Deltaproteobacteria bacterium]